MGRFNDALRKAIYDCDCPISSLSAESRISRQSIYSAMRGVYKLRRGTARALAMAVIAALHAQIDRKKREVDELKRTERELRNAFDEEYGSGETRGG